MKIQKMKIPAILGALLLAGTLSAGAQMNSDSLYKEPYRPQYHFSPEKGWIGDPSGFMYYQGKYHMYWWGKVESTDLVHYQQITPYAMTGADDNISYFTGSAVIDKNNTHLWHGLDSVCNCRFRDWLDLEGCRSGQSAECCRLICKTTFNCFCCPPGVFFGRFFLLAKK